MAKGEGVSSEGEVVALDAKIAIDSNAAFRQAELVEWHDEGELEDSPRLRDKACARDWPSGDHSSPPNRSYNEIKNPPRTQNMRKDINITIVYVMWRGEGLKG